MSVAPANITTAIDELKTLIGDRLSTNLSVRDTHSRMSLGIIRINRMQLFFQLIPRKYQK